MFLDIAIKNISFSTGTFEMTWMILIVVKAKNTDTISIWCKDFTGLQIIQTVFYRFIILGSSYRNQ